LCVADIFSRVLQPIRNVRKRIFLFFAINRSSFHSCLSSASIGHRYLGITMATAAKEVVQTRSCVFIGPVPCDKCRRGDKRHSWIFWRMMFVFIVTAPNVFLINPHVGFRRVLCADFEPLRRVWCFVMRIVRGPRRQVMWSRSFRANEVIPLTRRPMFCFRFFSYSNRVASRFCFLFKPWDNVRFFCYMSNHNVYSDNNNSNIMSG